MTVEAVKAVPPEIVSAAEEVVAIFRPDGVREEQCLQRLEQREGVECLYQHLLFHIQLDLARTGEEAEIRVAVKGDLVAVMFIGTEVVEQHAVPFVDDGHVLVHAVPRVDAEACDGMAALPQRLLYITVVPSKSHLQGVDVLLGTEGELQCIVAAVEGEGISRRSMLCAVEKAVIIPLLVCERERGYEVVRHTMDDRKVHGLWLLVKDRELELEAEFSRARTLRRTDEPFI